MPFESPVIVEGAEASLVSRVESDVIIPGSSHEDLWVHPELVCQWDAPHVCEVRARTTDRHGRDQHAESHYFSTEDDFRTLRPVEAPALPDWRFTALKREDVVAGPDPAVQLPDDARWSWYMNYVHLDADTILQPFYTDASEGCRAVATVTARLEGGRAVLLHVSNARTNHCKRGFLEPHIAEHGGRHFMTVRAEDGCGYAMASDDCGRQWSEPVPWTWDGGEVVAMDTTMTKLLAHTDGLVLVYTRIKEDNRQYFRSRTPLHCADVDPATLRIRRKTERIIVPNRSTSAGRGALLLGNFWVWPINADKSYVVVGEWPRDGRPQNGDIWLAKICWRRPNRSIRSDL